MCFYFCDSVQIDSIFQLRSGMSVRGISKFNVSREEKKPSRHDHLFPYQISGEYCRTVNYCIHGEKTHSEMYKRPDGYWGVLHMVQNEIPYGYTEKHLKCSDALKALKKMDADLIAMCEKDYKNTKYLSEEKSLGVNHYLSYASWKNISLKGKETHQGHIVENSVCPLSQFNQKKEAVDKISVEAYVTKLTRFLVKMRIDDHQAITSKMKSRTAFPYPLGENTWKPVENLLGVLKEQQEAIKALNVQNNEVDIDLVKFQKLEMKLMVEKLFFNETGYYQNITFIQTEFNALQVYTECNWSRIPDVKTIFDKQCAEMGVKVDKNGPSSPHITYSSGGFRIL